MRPRRAVLVGLAAIHGAGGAQASLMRGPAAPIGQVGIFWNGARTSKYCLGVDLGNPKNVLVTDCHRQADQQWYVSDESLKNVGQGAHQCLDVHLENGNNLRMAHCNGQETQKLAGDGDSIQFVQSSGLTSSLVPTRWCMEMQLDGDHNVGMRACTGASNQQWTFEVVAQLLDLQHSLNTQMAAAIDAEHQQRKAHEAALVAKAQAHEAAQFPSLGFFLTPTQTLQDIGVKARVSALPNVEASVANLEATMSDLHQRLTKAEQAITRAVGKSAEVLEGLGPLEAKSHAEAEHLQRLRASTQTANSKMGLMASTVHSVATLAEEADTRADLIDNRTTLYASDSTLNSLDALNDMVWRLNDPSRADSVPGASRNVDSLDKASRKLRGDMAKDTKATLVFRLRHGVRGLRKAVRDLGNMAEAASPLGSANNGEPGRGRSALTLGADLGLDDA